MLFIAFPSGFLVAEADLCFRNLRILTGNRKGEIKEFKVKIIMTDRAKTDKVSEFKNSSIVSIKNCDKSRSSIGIGIEVSETKKSSVSSIDISMYRTILSV